MPANKKSAKKPHAKKTKNKKPAAQAAPVKAVEQAEPVSAKPTLGRGFWGLLVLAVIALVIIVAVATSRQPDDSGIKSSDSSGDSRSLLHVVPEQQGGISSSEASNALQPQQTGLQQSQPAQTAGSPNLQAQPTPGINR